jgi:hypothetical protein
MQKETWRADNLEVFKGKLTSSSFFEIFESSSLIFSFMSSLFSEMKTNIASSLLLYNYN